MPRDKRIIPPIISKLKDIVVVVFLPLYFTVSGLRTNIGLLNDASAWGVALLMIVVEFFGKLAGTGLSARFVAKMSVKDSIVVGICLQTKGLVALVVFNLGVDYGVITPKFFSTGVLMVLVIMLFSNHC